MTDASPDYPTRDEVPALGDDVAAVTLQWQGETGPNMHLTTTSSKSMPLLSLPFPFRVLAVGFVFNNSLAASNSDYWRFTLGNTPPADSPDVVNWYAEYTTKPPTDGGVVGGGGSIIAKRAWWPDPVWIDAINGPVHTGYGTLYLAAQGVGKPGKLNGPSLALVRWQRA